MTASVWIALCLIAAQAKQPTLAPATVPKSSGTEVAQTIDVGQQLDEFLLEAADGHRVSLREEVADRQLTVLAWTSVGCPITKLLAPRLGRLERDYRGRGVRFLGINPNIQDDAAEIIEFARNAEIDFPILLDQQHVLTDRLAVTRTTEVFVLDGEFRVVYRGAVDDQYTVGAAKPAPNNDFLIDALEAALAGETIDPERTDAPGCLVGRVNVAPEAADITFFRDVAPILWSRCIECHRPGQAGPMSFLTHADAGGYAPMIAEVTGSGRMPPWHADPGVGHFANARRLTESEKRVLELWAASGAKAGDPADAPPAPLFANPQWSIGRPDAVVALPEAQSVPATGVVPYRHIVVDPGFTEEHWVSGVEIRPSNPAVTHHVMVFLIEPGLTPQQALTGTAAQEGTNHFAQIVPGGRAIELPAGHAKRVPAGARFLFQLHYTPNGTATTDQTRMALRFATDTVTHEIAARAVMNMGLAIPPRAEAAEFTATSTFKAPTRLLSLMPHMHVRGKSMRIELERAGSRRALLDVPHYDFNWQHTYQFAQPIDLDAGDKIHVTAVFDNSAANPHNPDPSARVRFGEQTFDEMLVGYLSLEAPLPSAASGSFRK
ncbi:MAG: redoxin domain-containing protein [Planctomycetes bacterium]|nr:redoxin domain-containing protein [Planctomycetota bacterium]